MVGMHKEVVSRDVFFSLSGVVPGGADDCGEYLVYDFDKFFTDECLGGEFGVFITAGGVFFGEVGDDFGLFIFDSERDTFSIGGHIVVEHFFSFFRGDVFDSPAEVHRPTG